MNTYAVFIGGFVETLTCLYVLLERVDCVVVTMMFVLFTEQFTMLARHTKWCMCLAQKRCYSAGSSHPHVAVVGGGPGGFYTAQHILKVCTLH